nr:transcription initiation factor TFIID subunit 13 [Tanacetum cinerariifolium]
MKASSIFGGSQPLPETVALVEDIMVEYVTDMVDKAQDIASKRGKLLTEDFLFLIQKYLCSQAIPFDAISYKGRSRSLSSRGMSWGVWFSSNLQLANTSMEYNPLYDADNVMPSSVMLSFKTTWDGLSSILLLLY